MMEIVIAILLLLILVALVSGNKDAASSIRKTIRIGLFVFLIGLVWLILIAYSIFYFFSYTEQDWSNIIGLGFSILILPFLAWANKAYVRELFLKDNKTIFKTLAYILLGVIAWVTANIFYQEQKKIDPNLGWTILIIGLIISGCVILNRALKKGWITAFTFQKSPWDQVNDKYENLIDQEKSRWAEYKKNWNGAENDPEFNRLSSEYDDKIDALFQESYLELEKVRGVKKKDDWWLFVFYYFIAFICFGLIGYLWDHIFTWVMTLNYVGGREWMAYLTMIGTPLVAIGALIGIVDDVKNKKV